MEQNRQIYYSPLERASNLPKKARENALAVAMGVVFHQCISWVSDTGALVVDGAFVEPMGGEKRMAGRREFGMFFDLSTVFLIALLFAEQCQ